MLYFLQSMPSIAAHSANAADTLEYASAQALSECATAAQLGAHHGFITLMFLAIILILLFYKRG